MFVYILGDTRSDLPRSLVAIVVRFIYTVPEIRAISALLSHEKLGKIAVQVVSRMCNEEMVVVQLPQ